jgi:hypothetical protein
MSNAPTDSIPPLVAVQDLAKVGMATDPVERAAEVIPLILDLLGNRVAGLFAGPQRATSIIPSLTRLPAGSPRKRSAAAESFLE